MESEEIKIINTTNDDFPEVLWLFEEAMKMHKHNGYQVWETMDSVGLQNDIVNKLQYKILRGQDNI